MVYASDSASVAVFDSLHSLRTKTVLDVFFQRFVCVCYNFRIDNLQRKPGRGMDYVFAYPRLLCNSVYCLFLSKGRKNEKIKNGRMAKKSIRTFNSLYNDG